VALDIAKVRIRLDKSRIAKKDFFLRGGREVDRQAKEIKEKLIEMETPHLEAYKKIDNYRKERKAQFEADIQSMILIPNTVRMNNWNSAGITKQIDDLVALDFNDFDEQRDNAIMARNKCVESLRLLLAEAEKKEQDAAELAKYQAEAEAKAKVEYEEKLKAEAREKAEAAQAKAEEDQKQAEEAAKVAEAARIQAEKDAEIAAEKAEADKIQAAKDAQAAAIRAETDRIAAEKVTKENAENARIQAEADQVEAEKVAAENARQAEVARQEAETNRLKDEAAKREADQAHKKKINNDALDALVLIGVSPHLGKEIIIAVSQGRIPHITLSY